MRREKREKHNLKKIIVAGHFTEEEAHKIEEIAKEYMIPTAELLRASVDLLCNFVESTGYFPITGSLKKNDKKIRQFCFRIDEKMNERLRNLSALLNDAPYSFLIRTAVTFYLKERGRGIDDRPTML